MGRTSTVAVQMQMQKTPTALRLYDVRPMWCSADVRMCDQISGVAVKKEKKRFVDIIGKVHVMESSLFNWYG